MGAAHWSEGLGATRIPHPGCAGVEPLVLLGEVVTPVLIEVTVADHREQREDGFGALQAPPGPGDVERVAIKWRQAPSMMPVRLSAGWRADGQSVR
jgi:hypothetical protein